MEFVSREKRTGGSTWILIEVRVIQERTEGRWGSDQAGNRLRSAAE